MAGHLADVVKIAFFLTMAGIALLTHERETAATCIGIAAGLAQVARGSHRDPPRSISRELPLRPPPEDKDTPP